MMVLMFKSIHVPERTCPKHSFVNVRFIKTQAHALTGPRFEIIRFSERGGGGRAGSGGSGGGGGGGQGLKQPKN